MTKKSALQKRIEELESALFIRALEDIERKNEADRAAEEAALLQPYELVQARTTYVSGEDPFQTAVALLAEASQVEFAAGPSVTSIVLTVSYVPEGAPVAAGLSNEPSYYAGQVTVEG